MIPRRWAHEVPGEYNRVQKWIRELDQEGLDILLDWEREIARFLGVSSAAAVNSGRQGLRIILERLGLTRDDEVIVPAYTLWEMLPFVQSLGMRLVPADIDPRTFNITPESVTKRINKRTRAILALHIFGNPCDIIGLRALAQEHGLKLIEDCAHALGATIGGQYAGTFGDAAFFSFEVTKMVNTYGGGIVAAKEADIVESVRLFNVSEPAGYVSLKRKMDAVKLEKFLFHSRLMYLPLLLLALPQFQPLMNHLYRGSQHTQKKRERYMPAQARLGIEKLRTLEERLQLRRDRAALYTSLLKPDIVPQQVIGGALPTWYFYVVMVPDDASSVRRRLLVRGVDAGAGDEIMDNCAERLGYADCPNASSVFRRALALPMFDGISERACEIAATKLNQLI